MSELPPTSERRPDRAALVIAALLAGLAALIAFNTYNLPSGIASYSRIGPRAFPYTIAVCLLLLAGGTAVAAWRGGFPERLPDDWRPIAWIVGGLVAQIAAISYVGFALATGFVFAATAAAFGRREVWLTYPIGVAISLAVWFAFAEGLNLVLPSGPLENLIIEQFRSLTSMLPDMGTIPETV